MTTPVRWYALAVQARQEKAAAKELLRRGVEVFLPSRQERRAWSDRIQRVERALFPGYLFVRLALDARRRNELLAPRQVIELVGRLPGDARVAQAFPNVQIDSLRTVLAAEREIDPIDRLREGDAVRVVRGPLKGAHGVVERGADGQRRLWVQVELLGRGVRVTLSGEDVVEAVDSEGR